MCMLYKYVIAEGSDCDQYAMYAQHEPINFHKLYAPLYLEHVLWQRSHHLLLLFFFLVNQANNLLHELRHALLSKDTFVCIAQFVAIYLSPI